MKIVIWQLKTRKLREFHAQIYDSVRSCVFIFFFLFGCEGTRVDADATAVREEPPTDLQQMKLKNEKSERQNDERELIDGI